MNSVAIKSEVKSGGKSAILDAAIRGRRSIALAASLASAAISHTALGARPVKVDHVVAGSASFTTVGSKEVIRASDKTIIDFNTFNVAPGQTVQFIQPSKHATVMDYISSSTPAQINGTITANGIVYFVDPAGIVFGQHSIITASQVFAVGGQMTNSDFLAGTNKFELTSSVVNDGVINAAAVAMTGMSVINNGSVTANGGLVTFAVGNEVFIGPKGDTMTAKVTATAATGSKGGSIQNNGTVSASGGGVSMVAGDVFSIALGSPSSVTASTINIVGGKSASTTVSGSLNASATKGVGGNISVTGKTVALAGATLNASGQTGGGNIKVGGDFHGKGALPTAQTTTIDSASSLNASATQSGAGGTIAVWSNEATAIHGTVAARGIGAAGGYIETSGHGTLDVSGISLVASGKTAGTWLMDPTDVVISDTALAGILPGTGIFSPLTGLISQIASADITTALGLGTSVVINTTGVGNVATSHGDITYAAGNVGLSNIPVSASGATLTLNASRSIDIESPISATAGKLNIDLEAAGIDTTGTVTIGSSISTNGGSFTVGATTLSASVAVVTGGSISTNGGAVQINSTGNIAIGGAITATGATVALQSGAGVTQTAAVTAGTLMLTGTGDFVLNSTGNAITNLGVGSAATPATGAVNVASTTAMSVVGTGVQTSGNITLSASGITVGGAVSAPSQTVTLQSTAGITQTAPITAGTLALTGGGGITLASTTNAIGSVAVGTSTTPVTGDVSVSSGAAMTVASTGAYTGGNLTLSAPGITLSGAVSAPSQTVTLQSTAGITQTAPITAGTLALTGGGGITLASTSNAIGSVAVGTSTTPVTGAVSVSSNTAMSVASTGAYTGGDLTLSAPGITISGAVSASGQTVTLQSTTGISQTAAITAGTLQLIGGGGVTLNLASNAISNVEFGTSATPMTGDVGITSTTSVTVPSAGIYTSGNVGITAAGINVNGVIYAPGETVSMQSTAGITQTAAITATTLQLTGGGGVTFTAAGNAFINLGLGSSATPETGVVNIVNGVVLNIDGNGVFTNGNITLAAPSISTAGNSITSSAGMVSLTATTPTTGALTIGGVVSGTAVNLTADNMAITNTVTASTGPITIATESLANVALNDGAATALSLSAASLKELSAGVVAITASGTVYIGSAGSLDLSSTSYALNFTATTGSITFDGTTATGLSTGGAQNYLSAATVSAVTTLTAPNVTFKQAVNGTGALTSNASTEFDAAVSIGSLAVGGTTKMAIVGGTSISTSGSQSYTGVVTLTDPTTLNAGTSNITLTSTVGGGLNALAITAASTTFGGTVSVSNLTMTGAATLNGALASITTTGTQSYSGAVTITGITPTLTASSIAFQNTLGGTGGLATSGTTTFGKAVTLGLNLTTTGVTDINTGTVSTSGTVDFAGGAVNLNFAGLTTISGSSVKFEQAVTGTAGTSLAVNGNAEFDGTVSTLSSLTVDGSSTINIATVPSISTSGTQSYNGNVTLKQSTTLAGTTIAFGSGYAVTMAGGTTNDALTITGAATIGSTISTAGLYVTGLAAIDTSSITTTGYQSYGQAVTLNYPTLITLTAEGNDGSNHSIIFSSSVDAAIGTTGQSALDLVTNNLAIITGAVGGTTQLTSFEVDIYNLSANAGLTLKGGAVNTAGAQIYDVPTTASISTGLNAGSIKFGSTFGIAGLTLTLDTTAGVTETSTGAITGTTGIVMLEGTGAFILDSANNAIGTVGTISTTAGAVTVVDSTALAIASGGLVTSGAVSLTTPAMTISTPATISGTTVSLFADAMSISGLNSVTTTNITGVTLTLGPDKLANVDLNDSTTPGSAVSITTTELNDLSTKGTLKIQTGGSIYLGSLGALDLTTGGFGLELSAGTGAIVIDSTLPTATTSLTTKQGMTFDSPVTLSAPASLTAPTINLTSTITGANVLTSTASTMTTFGGAVNIGSLTVTGPTTLNSNATSITTVGGQSYTGAVTLDVGATLSAQGPLGAGTVAFVGSTSTVDGGFALSISSTAGITFGGAVGVGTSLTSLQISQYGAGAGSSVAINGGTVKTTGAQTYNVPASINQTTTLNGSAVTFGTGATILASGQTLNIYGSSTFGGNVTLLGLHDYDSTIFQGSATNVTTTGGSQNYDGSVALNVAMTMAGSNVTFGSGVSGLALTSNAATTFGGAVSVAGLSVGGTAAINTGTVTSTTTQYYSGAVTLGSTTAVTLTAEGATAGNSITFASTLDGNASATNPSLDIKTAATTVFDNAVGVQNAVGSLQIDGYSGGSTPGVIVNTATVTTAGSQAYNVPITLDATTTLTTNTASTSSITFNSGSTISGASYKLEANSPTTTFGGTVTVAGLKVDGTTTLNGTAASVITTGGSQSYLGGVTLSVASGSNLLTPVVPLVMTGTSVSFGSTVGTTSTDSLAITGATTFGGTVNIGALSVIGTTAINTTGITTGGSQIYTGAVTLGSNTTLLAGAPGSYSTVTFFGSTSTVNGNYSLTSDANTTFGATVGVGNLLVAGTTTIKTAGITTTTFQNYQGAVTLGTVPAVTLTAQGASSGNSVTFGGTLDGSPTLAVSAAGTTSFDGVVGGGTPLGSLQVSGISGGSTPGVTVDTTGVTTAGSQSYNVPMMLASTTTLTTNTPTTSSITFSSGSTIDGSFGLTLTTPNTTFGGAIGSATKLASLTVSPGGTTTLNGTASSISTTGAQSYGGAFALGVASATTPSTPVLMNANTVTFSGMVGTYDVDSLAITGNTTFNNTVGLANLKVTGSSTFQSLASTVTTVGGSQTYTGNVTLSVPLTTYGTAVTFGGTVNGSGLTSNAGTTFDGTVNVTGLAVNGTTLIQSSATTITTTGGSQVYNGAVTLGVSTTTSGNTVTFGLTSASTVSGLYSLTSNAATMFDGVVSIASLGVNGTTNLAIAGLPSVSTTGTQNYNGLVTLSSPTTLKATTSSVTFTSGSTVTGAAEFLSVNTPTTTFGGSVTVASLTTSGAAILNGTLTTITTTNGTQTYGGAVTLSVPIVGMSGTSVTFDGSVGTTSATALGVTAATTFDGTVNIGTLSVTGTTLVNTTAITTAGTQTYLGAVTLDSNTTMSAGSIPGYSTVTFLGSTSTVTGTAYLLASNANTIFDGVVSIGSLNVAGTSAINTTSITTATFQSYQGAVTLGTVAGVTLSAQGATAGNSITFQSSLDGSPTLAINTAGMTNFDGLVGGGTPLGSLQITGISGSSTPGVTVDTTGVTTTGLQTYNVPMTLASTTTLTTNNALAGITFSSGSTITGAPYSLTAQTTAATFGGNVTVGNFHVTGTTTLDGIAATILTSGGAQLYDGSVTLGVASGVNPSTPVTMTGNAVTFGSTVGTSDGDSLLVTATTTFNNVVNLANLTVTGASTFQNLASTVTTTGGAQLYNGAMTLDVPLTTNGSTVTFNGTVTDGGKSTGSSLVSNAATTFDGNVNITNLTVNGTSAIDTASMSTSTFQIYNGAVKLGSPTGNTTGVTLTAKGTDSTGRSVTFVSTLDGSNSPVQALEIYTTGWTTFGGVVGGLTSPNSVKVDSYPTAGTVGAVAINTSAITTLGSQTYDVPATLASPTGAVLLTAPTTATFSSGSTITGVADSLKITSPNTTFGGSINVGNLTVSNAATLNGTLTTITTTNGTQTYGGAVTLSVPATTMNGTTVTFDSTIGTTEPAGAGTLTANAITTFDGNVSMVGNLTVNGATTIDAPIIGTGGGNQLYNGTVEVSVASVLTGSSITFNKTVDGSSLTSNGATTFFGNVTTTDLTVNGTTAIDTGSSNPTSIITRNFQLYNGAVTVDDASGVTLTANGVDGAGRSITFNTTLDASAGTATPLQLNTYELTTFGGAVGAKLNGMASALYSLKVDPTATSNHPSLTVAGGIVNTTTTQVYDVPVTLTAGTQMNATHITFSNTVTGTTGGSTLLGNANTIFNGIVNTTTVVVTGTTDIEGGASSITTTGLQQYDGAVTIGVPVTLTGSTVTFKSTVNGASLTSTAATTFDGNVSVANLTVNGTSTINTQSITTGTYQYYNGAVGIDDGSGVILTSNGTDAANHSITFVKTLDSTGTTTALLVDTTGITTFQQPVGSNSALANLTVTGIGNANAGAAINGGLVDTVTSQAYNVPVTLGDTGVITTMNATTVLFGKTLNGTALTSNANTTFDGIVNVTSLIVNGTTNIATTGITTATSQLYDGAVTLTDPVTLSGTTVVFKSTVNGASLISNAATTFDGNVTVASLTVNGITAIDASAITTGTFQLYNGLVTLNNPTQITLTGEGTGTGNSSVTFVSTLDAGTGATGQALDVVVDGVSTFGGAVGKNSKLLSLQVDPYQHSGLASAAINGSLVSTNTTQTYNVPVTIGAVTTLNGTIAKFSDTLNGGYAMTSNAATIFDGNVGVSNLTVNGTTTTDTGSITTATFQDYNGAVTLQAALATNAGTTVTFVTTVTGQSLVSTANTTIFDGDFNIANLTVNGITDINASVNGTNTFQLYNGAVALGVGTSLTGSTVTFKSTVNGQSLASTAATTFDGNVNITNLTVNGTSAIDTATITTGTFQDYNGAVALDNAGKITLTSNGTNATGQSVTFVKTLDAAGGSPGQILDIVTTGVAGFQGAVGTTPLATLTVDPVGGAGSTLVTGGSVTTTSTQTYNVPVTLGTATTTNGSTVTFNKTLGGSALTSNAATIFNGNVGIANLTDNGTTAINTPVVNTTTFQDFNGAVTLGSALAVTLTANGTDGSGHSITFVKTLDGNVSGTQALDVVTTGLTTFGGAVGTTPLQSLQINPQTGSGAAVAINGGAVTTTSFQTYNVPVTLGIATVTKGSTNTFTRTITGAGLTSDAVATILDGNVTVAGLIVNGTTQINTGIVTTQGSQLFGGATTLGDPVAPATDAFNVILTAGTNVTFSTTLDSSKTATANQSLDVIAAGLTTLTGTVGSGVPLYSLQLDGGTTAGAAINGGAVTTRTYQTFNVPVTILNPTGAAAGGFNTTLTAGADPAGKSVIFNKMLDAAGAGQMVNIVASGLTSLNAPVGKTTSLGDLEVDAAPGSTTATIGINGLVVTTAGTQVYNVPVSLGNPNASVTGAFNTVLTGSAVSFTKTVDANTAVPVGQSLNVIATGQTIFQQPVGSIGSLLSLQLDPLNGSTTAGAQINGGLVTTSSYQAFNVPVILDNVTAAASGGFNTVLNASTVTFTQTVDSAKSAASGQALDVVTSGETTFQQPVGSTTPLLSVQIDAAAGSTVAGAAINGGAVTTTTTQTFNVPVTVGNLAAVSSAAPFNTTLSGSTVTFNKTLDASSGSQQLDVISSGLTTFMQKVGSIVALAGLQVDALNGSASATTAIDGGVLTTTGQQTYNVPVTLADTTVATATTTLTGSNVTFGKTLNAGAGGQSVDVVSSGTSTFVGTVGSAVAPQLQNVQVDGGVAAVNGGAVTTAGTQVYNVPVTLGNPVSTSTSLPFNTVLTAGTDASGNSVTFSKTVDANSAVGTGQSLNISAPGVTNLVQSVGSTTPLQGLQVQGAVVIGATSANTTLLTVNTTGTQVYQSAKGIGLDQNTQLQAGTFNTQGKTVSQIQGANVTISGPVTDNQLQPDRVSDTLSTTSFAVMGYDISLQTVKTGGSQTYTTGATGIGSTGFVLNGDYDSYASISMLSAYPSKGGAQVQLAGATTINSDSWNDPKNATASMPKTDSNNVTLNVAGISSATNAAGAAEYGLKIGAGTTFLVPSSTGAKWVLPTGVITVGGDITAKTISMGWGWVWDSTVGTTVVPAVYGGTPAVASIVFSRDPSLAAASKPTATQMQDANWLVLNAQGTATEVSTESSIAGTTPLRAAAFSMDPGSKMSVTGWDSGLEIANVVSGTASDGRTTYTTNKTDSANLSDINVQGSLMVDVKNELYFVPRSQTLDDLTATAGDATKDGTVDFVATQNLQIQASSVNKLTTGQAPHFAWGDASDGAYLSSLPASLVLTSNSVSKYVSSLPGIEQVATAANQSYTTDLVATGSAMNNQITYVVPPSLVAQLPSGSGLSSTEKDLLQRMGIAARDPEFNELLDGLDGRVYYYQQRPTTANPKLEVASARIPSDSVRALLDVYNKYYSSDGSNSKDEPKTAKMQLAFENAWNNRSDQQATGDNPADVIRALYEDRQSREDLNGLHQVFLKLKQLGLTTREEPVAKTTILNPVIPDLFYNLNNTKWVDVFYDAIMNGPSLAVSPAPAPVVKPLQPPVKAAPDKSAKGPQPTKDAVAVAK